MPKRVTEAELEPIEAALLRYPAGLSLVQVQDELRGAISRRTLSRRFAALLAAGRIHRRGESRSARYLHGPAPTAPGLQRIGRESGERTAITTSTAKPSVTEGRLETPEGVVTIELSPVSRDILAYVSRPAAGRTPRGYERSL